jgi:hypothetical protein
MIGEILSTLNIIEKAGRFIGWVRKTQQPPTETVSSRFIRLFERHDVHRNQIPRFFGHGLTVQDVRDEASLLSKLDDPLLDAACSLFGVRREWLEGAESQVYPCHDFYKRPEDVAPFLKVLKESNPDGRLNGILIAPTEQQGNALIVLDEVVGAIGEKPIYRHHLCSNWLFDYWKSRAYMTACVAIAWKHGVCIRGSYLPSKEIKRIVAGEALFQSEDGGAIDRSGKPWYPEDMALKPEAFLSGVNPEQNRHGLASALELWLQLEENGYMDTGLPMYPRETIRRSFEKARGELC